MKIILFFGPPGSGKGTQANILLQNFSNLVYIATGDLIRKNINQQTEIGKIAEKYINQGLLVPSEIINQMVKEEISKLKSSVTTIKGIILDGYPRTIDQLQFIIRNFSEPCITFFFDLSLEKVIERISYRRICPNCNSIYHMIYNKPQKDEICDKCNTNLIQRKDDKEEVIKKRYKIYLEETLPIIEKMRELELNILKIDASQEINKINQIITEAINEML
ncbi:MAG: adenylate kinase family protein [bacterium]